MGIRVPLSPLGKRLFVIQLVAMTAMEMSGPFWSAHVLNMPGDADFLQLAAAAAFVLPMLGVMISSAFWGRMGDKYGHKTMLLRALAGLAITQLGLAFADTAESVLALRFLQGLSAGFIAPAMAYGASVTEPEERVHLFVWLQASTNLGSLIGPVIGGLILDFGVFASINKTSAVLCALCLVAVSLALPKISHSQTSDTAKKAEKPEQVNSSVSEAMGRQLVRLVAMLQFSRMISLMPFALYLAHHIQASQTQAGLSYGMMAFGFLVGALFWPRCFSNLAVSRLLLAQLLIVAGCSLVALTLSYRTSWYEFTALYFVWGALLAGTTPILNALISKSRSNTAQGKVLGRSYSLHQLGSILGVLFGALVHYLLGLESIYIAVAIAYALCLLFLCHLWWGHKTTETSVV